MKTEGAKLGGGVYTSADAARILKISPQKANYWFRHYLKNNHFKSNNFQYHFNIKETVAVNFLTLMEMYVFYSLRQNKIGVKEIVKTHQYLSKLLSTPYPFAKQAIYTDGGKLLFNSGEIYLSTDGSLQTKIALELDKFFKKITFSKDGFASIFHPLGSENVVVVNPEHQFGKPIIEGTNIKTQTVFNLYKSGENIELISELYNITEKQINDVIAFSKAA
jgi:uncharacterized protein (DUF433 family)